MPKFLADLKTRWATLVFPFLSPGTSKIKALPWFTRGDLDGFFGLFIDNLLQLMLIGYLCKALCGFPSDLVTGQVLPGAALSILLGNLFYAWQARRVALKAGRPDTTALPFGINTPSLIAFILLIMAPIYRETGSYKLAWQAGLFACFLNGVMETGGAFVGDWLRRNTPRAALLCALAGVAITFIAMDFIFQIFANPAVGLIPTFLILISYSSRIKWPFALPGGFLAVLVGTLLYWPLHSLAPNLVTATLSSDPILWSVYPPKPVPTDLFALVFNANGWKYLAVIIPMGLFNVIGSLLNLESAEAAGDRYPTKPSLLWNGFATFLAAFLGSPFPTTIYIGHPGWKALGARHGYSILNGFFITLLCLTGGVSFFLMLIPKECILGILLWVAIIITAQAFMEIPKEHSLAVAFGLIPTLAAYFIYLIESTLRSAGSPLTVAMADKLTADNLYVRGIIILSQGSLLTSMIFAAVMVFLIEKKFLKAAQWVLAASVFSFIGLIHAYRLTDSGVQDGFGITWSPRFGLLYLILAGFLFLIHFHQKSNAKSSRRGKKKAAKKDEFSSPPTSKVGYL
ncbi:MAG TPA: NCS2 family permease [bacterium]|nr:NCS2 family permease [bacterium]